MALLIEAQGRGLIITMEDVQEFLADIHQDAPVPDAQAALFSPMAFDGLLAWCVATDRAQPTIVGELMQEQPETLEFMLQSSRAGSN
jgi:hypothetical protein